MSGANYWHCEICNQKALYDDSDEERQDIVVMHASCMWQDRKDREADLRERITKAIEHCRDRASNAHRTAYRIAADIAIGKAAR